METRFKAAGGTVDHEREPYISRPSDQELLTLLAEGHFGYVLAPRQSGKSTLAVWTMAQLRGMGLKCAYVDLSSVVCTDSSMGERGRVDSLTVQSLGAEQLVGNTDEFLYSLAVHIADELEIGDDAPEQCVAQAWADLEGASSSTKWTTFIKRWVLEKTSGRIIIFLDEIEALSATAASGNALFATVRSFYNGRTTNSDLRRLTFCLLGVQSRHELSSEPGDSPFNVGLEVDLLDFTRDQLDDFLGKISDFPDPAGLLDAIYYWTAGHPWMTQYLLQAALSERDDLIGPTECREWAARVADRHLLRRNANVDYPRRYLTESRLHTAGHFRVKAIKAVKLYHKILDGLRPLYDNADDVHEFLYLSGIVARHPQGDIGQALVLRPRNKVFERVYTEAWVRSAEERLLILSQMREWELNDRKSKRLLGGEHLAESYEVFQRNQDLGEGAAQYLLHSAMHALESAERHLKLKDEQLGKKEEHLADLRNARDAAETRSKTIRRWRLGASAVAGAIVSILCIALMFGIGDMGGESTEASEKGPFTSAQVKRLNSLNPAYGDLVDTLKLSEEEGRRRRAWEREFARLQTRMASARSEPAFQEWLTDFLRFASRDDPMHPDRLQQYLVEAFALARRRGVAKPVHEDWYRTNGFTRSADISDQETTTKALRLYHEYLEADGTTAGDAQLTQFLDMVEAEGVLAAYYPDVSVEGLQEGLRARVENRAEAKAQEVARLAKEEAERRALYTAAILDCSNADIPEVRKKPKNGVEVRRQLIALGFAEPVMKREYLDSGWCHKLHTDKCAFATEAGRKLCDEVTAKVTFPDGSPISRKVKLQLVELSRKEEYQNDRTSPDKVRRQVLGALFGNEGDERLPEDAPRHTIALRLGQDYDNEKRKILKKLAAGE